MEPGCLVRILVGHIWRSLKWLAWKSIGSFTPAFSSIPRAWDFAAPVRGEHFIRIETADGKFFGGWFSVNSFVSTYPEPHDIFVERQWKLDERGRFLHEVTGSNGLWYAVQPGDIIDWINPHDASTADLEAGTTDGERRTEVMDGRCDAGQSHPDPGGPAWGKPHARWTTSIHFAEVAAAWLGGLLHGRLVEEVGTRRRHEAAQARDETSDAASRLPGVRSGRSFGRQGPNDAQ